MTEPCLSVSLFCRCPIYMSMRVSLWAVPVVDVCLRVSLLCGCPRRCRCGLSLWQDSAVLEWRVSLWDCRPGPVDRCSRPRLHERKGPTRSGGKGSPDGAYLSAAPGGNWPDGNTGGIDNYPVCLRHSGQQSHTYYCLFLSVSWFSRCPCHRATCVMTVSVLTLLTGRCGRNCLYLN